ncbi:flagellar biosynthetic protein FlhB [Duganella sacchari]|uniref:Flagellar biosynthetic protein FlhB n=1 Tax=Duganella sacchari TaxID=551987 RepID=A0A1M7PLS5_9BURK|nr:EscU/YscU/HrcU family type III secretion system export apparatus switch protein [Duganella sacchari]SHN18195.1 flagellar biosynthetic protein FlhB [Duganella sacchari]
MAEQDLDRSEAASPYKLQKARERGQVSKSSEIISATVLAVALVYIYARGWDSLASLMRFDQALLQMADQLRLDHAVFWHLAGHMGRHYLALTGPLFGALMLAAIAANLMQTGPLLAMEPLKPDWDRLNPVNGMKKILSVRTLFDAARACAKLVLLTMVVVYALRDLLRQQFFFLSALTPHDYLQTLLGDIAALGMKMALMLGLLAVVDLVYTGRQFAKRMRMSKRELKDEVKQREGDPRIRSRLRQLRNEMLKRSQSAQRTREADVLITNPTHVAVALRYVHGEMRSPQLLAKGAGVLAAQMRQIATRHHIPIVQNAPLARRLFRELALEQPVPPNLYAEVARIIVWVFAMRQARQQPAETQA